jgi:hypothetical protein
MWEERGAPATDEQLAALEKELGTRLPEELRAFLLHADGANGWFAEFYVEIFSIERLIEANVRSDFAVDFPFALVFGSDGSREYLALDRRREPHAVVMIEVTCVSPDDFVYQASSFDEFLEQLPTTGLRFE